MKKYLLTLAACLFAVQAWAADTIPLTIQTKQAGPLALNVEYATDDAGREKGLMFRKNLENDGMIFVFPKTDFQQFWMKNTLIPLDMIFVNASNEVIYIYPNATPLSLKPIGPNTPIRAVIELAGGRAIKDGISVGDEITYALPSSVTVR